MTELQENPSTRSTRKVYVASDRAFNPDSGYQGDVEIIGIFPTLLEAYQAVEERKTDTAYMANYTADPFFIENEFEYWICSNDEPI